METRKLGRTGLDVSLVCLGTMTFGEQNTEAEGHAQMDRAVDAGVTFFDTAELYPIPPKNKTQGRTEEIIGTWLKSRGGRDRVVIATKAVGRTDAKRFRDHGNGADLSRASLREGVEKSLRRLQTDHIDLYQLHWPDREVSQFGANPVVFKEAEPAAGEVPIAETLAALAELVAEGKIRHVGLSNESAWGTMRFLAESDAGRGPRMASIQNGYNLVNRTFETALAEVALREDVGLLAYSPLAQGYLTGKYRDGALPKGSRKQLFNRLQRYEGPGAAEAIDAYVDLAGEIGWSPADLALRFVASRPFVTSVIIGATSIEQLHKDLAAFDGRGSGQSWSAEIEERVNAIHVARANPCP